MKKLYLIRGVSGSGKTTLAKELERWFSSAGLEVACVAADDWFYDSRGDYVFYAEHLSTAHGWCKHSVDNAMSTNYDAVIVHNTFTTEKEMKPYLTLAEKYGYEVTTMVVENRHGNGSVHDVPDENLARQCKRLRDNIKLI